MTTNSDTHESELLDTIEAARVLHVAPRTLIRWRNERTGPPWVRVGKQIRYRRRSLTKWLDEMEVDPVRREAVG